MEPMETIHNNAQPTTGKDRQLIRPRNIYLGSTLLGVGVIWLLKNFGVISYDIFDAVFSWPILLLVIGGYLLALRKWVAGGITGALGLCLLISDLANIPIPFNKITLPLLCIVAGVAILLNKH